MRVFAPGKLVLAGAYAVLEGAPAIVAAVSRGAVADTSRPASSVTPEVRAALSASSGASSSASARRETAPDVDASAMFASGRKLGLGASAAILVASLGALEAEAGADPSTRACRDRIFARARAAHADAQRGGSGLDVAASLHGGVIRYVVDAPTTRTSLPGGLRVTALACATSARTSDLRAAVDALAVRDPAQHRACMDELVAIANAAASAAGPAGDPAAFVEALRRTARGLARLGEAARVGLVPDGFDALEALAAREDAAFLVSGAGGGDVAVFIGERAPSARFLDHARPLGLTLLDLTIDDAGVRVDTITPLSSPTPHDVVLSSPSPHLQEP